MYKNDSNILEKLFNDYQGLLRKAAGQSHLRSIYDEAYAEAVLSFCEAVQKFDASLGVPFPGYAKAKIYGDLHTLFKKYRRTWQREAVLDSSEAGPLPRSAALLSFEESVINKNLLHEALQQLPPRQRQIISCTVLQGYTQAETAGLLKISQQAVAANKKQAVSRLKALLM